MTATRADGRKPSGGGGRGSNRASSSSELDTREFDAAVAVDRYSGADGYPALYVQVINLVD